MTHFNLKFSFAKFWILLLPWFPWLANFNEDFWAKSLPSLFSALCRAPIWDKAFLFNQAATKRPRYQAPCLFTHPIFESDFDCLTGKNRLHANSFLSLPPLTNQNTTKTSSLLTMTSSQQDKFVLSKMLINNKNRDRPVVCEIRVLLSFGCTGVEKSRGF